MLTSMLALGTSTHRPEIIPNIPVAGVRRFDASGSAVKGFADGVEVCHVCLSRFSHRMSTPWAVAILSQLAGSC
jgi:hypothetical protein